MVIDLLNAHDSLSRATKHLAGQFRFSMTPCEAASNFQARQIILDLREEILSEAEAIQARRTA